MINNYFDDYTAVTFSLKTQNATSLKQALCLFTPLTTRKKPEINYEGKKVMLTFYNSHRMCKLYE